MIRSHFGLQRNPFDPESVALLSHQQEIFDILRVHAQQGGLCLVLGEPGTGKSILKQSLLTHDPKRMITPVVNRTLHTYHNTLRILCEAFQIEFEGRDHHCERLLVQQAFSVHRAGKMLVPSSTTPTSCPPTACANSGSCVRTFPFAQPGADRPASTAPNPLAHHQRRNPFRITYSHCSRGWLLKQSNSSFSINSTAPAWP